MELRGIKPTVDYLPKAIPVFKCQPLLEKQDKHIQKIIDERNNNVAKSIGLPKWA